MQGQSEYRNTLLSLLEGGETWVFLPLDLFPAVDNLETVDNLLEVIAIPDHRGGFDPEFQWTAKDGDSDGTPISTHRVCFDQLADWEAQSSWDPAATEPGEQPVSPDELKRINLSLDLSHAAVAHGENTGCGFNLAIGDLTVLFRSAVSLLTDDQLERYFTLPGVVDLAELPEFEDLLANPKRA